MSSKPSTSHSQRNDSGVHEEVSFGDFTSINGLPRHELFEGDFSVLDGYSSVLNGDGLASPSFIYEQESNRAAEMQQKLADAQDTIRQLRHRLVRRTNVIEGIRKYYLRDVVTMKHILRELLSETERKEAWRQYEYILPSIDLKESLQLHAPERCAFQVTPCESCGGRLELIMRDNEEVEKLKKVIKEYKEREGRWRIKLADLDAQLETIKKEKAEYTKVHTDEKKVLYAEMKKLREEAEAYKEETHKTKLQNRKLKEENDGFRQINGDLQLSVSKLVLTEKELDLTKDRLAEANESVKLLKITEKTLTKELQQAKQDSRELSTTNESNTSTIKALQGEIRQLQVTIERSQLTYQELQESVEVNNKQNLELTNKVLELEDTIRNSAEENSKEIETYENTIEKMRGDLKAATKKSAEVTAECKKLKAKVEEKNILIEDLHKVNRNQELELLDNAEEIELLEQEIKAMQQFVKQKIAEQSRKAKEQRSNEPEHEEIVNFFKRLDEVEAHLRDLAEQAEKEKQLEEAASLSARLAKVPSVDGGVKEEEQVTSIMQRRAALRQQRTMRKSVELPSLEEKVKRVKRRIKPQAQESDKAGDGHVSAGEDEGEADDYGEDSDGESVRSRSRSVTRSKGKAKKSGSKISKVSTRKSESAEDAPPPSREKKASPALAPSASASSVKAPNSAKGKVKAKVKVTSRTRSKAAKSVKEKTGKGRAGSATGGAVENVGSEDVAEAVRLTTEALGMTQEDAGDDREEYEEQSSEEEGEEDEGAEGVASRSTESDEEEEESADENEEVVQEDLDRAVGASKAEFSHGKEKAASKPEKQKQPKAPKEPKEAKAPKAPKEKKVVIKKIIVKAEEEVLEPEEEDVEPELPEEADVVDNAEEEEPEPEEEEPLEIEEPPEEEEVVEEIEVIEQEALSEEEIARRKEVSLMRAADKETKQAVRYAKQEAKRLERENMLRERELKKQQKEAQRAAKEAARLEKERKRREREEERYRKHEEKMRAAKKVKIVTKDEVKDEETEVEAEADEVQVEAIEEGGQESSASEEENEEEEEPEADEGDIEVKVYNRTRKMSNRKAKAKPAPKKKKEKTKKPKPKPEIAPPVVEVLEVKVEDPVEVKPPPVKPKPKPPKPVTANPDNAVIDITYVRDGNSMFLEAQLKEALQNTLAKHDELDTDTMQKIVNGVLQTVGVLFDQTVKTMWDSMLTNKEGLDLAQKLSIILTGVLDVDEEATSENIAEACSKLIPIAGTTLNNSVTEMWKEKCELDDDILADLSPAIVDYESNSRHKKEYTEIFHSSSLHNAQETYDKLRSLYENSYRMNGVFHDMYDELSKQLVLFLSDWSKYKTASREAASRLEAEKEHIKAQYDQKISNLGKELSKGTILLERTMEKLKVAEVKIKELKAVEALYNTLETKHADLLVEHQFNKKELADMQVDYDLIKGEQKLYNTTMKELQENVCMAHEEGMKFQYHYVTTTLEKHEVEAALARTEQECKRLQAEYKILVDREYSRLNLLSTIAMQTEPEVMDMAIQTEFLVPPMDLRTVVVDKLSRSNVRQYPMVYSQSLDQLPSLSRGNTPGTGLREPGNNLSHRMSTASIFSTDTHLSEFQGAHTGLLAPHSPPLSKYHNTYNEEDINSFLSLRMPSGGGGAEGTYTSRSVSSSQSHKDLGGDDGASTNSNKPRLSKNKWGSSAGPMMVGKNIGDKSHNDMFIASSPFSSAHTAATPAPAAPVSYSIALDTSHSHADKQFNFDNIDLSGPPSPVVQSRKDLRDEELSDNANATVSHRSFKSPLRQHGSFADTKHIVYNHKFSDGSAKFRTVNGKRPEESVGDLGTLMISSSKNSSLKPLMSQSQKPQIGALNLAAAGLSSSSSLGQAGLSSITNVNSDTIKKMRKDLLSR